MLRWGPGYNGEDEPLSLLRDVIDAEEIKLDRSVRLFVIEVACCMLSSLFSALMGDRRYSACKKSHCNSSEGFSLVEFWIPGITWMILTNIALPKCQYSVE